MDHSGTVTNVERAKTIYLPFKDFFSAWSAIGDKSESSLERDQDQDELETSPERERGLMGRRLLSSSHLSLHVHFWWV